MGSVKKRLSENNLAFCIAFDYSFPAREPEAKNKWRPQTLNDFRAQSPCGDKNKLETLNVEY